MVINSNHQLYISVIKKSKTRPPHLALDRKGTSWFLMAGTAGTG
jgi:hypothetical protein